jgi:Fic family protein
MPDRDDRGQYQTAVNDSEILSFFGRAVRPYQTAQSVGDEFGLERSTAYRRLQRLADEGPLRKDEVGARAVVWWLPTDEPADRSLDGNE